MLRKQYRDLAYYQFEMWSHLRHGVFTRLGGASAAPWASLNMGGNVGDDPDAVRQNHVLMYAAAAVNPGKVCSLWQVHSADVMVVEGPVEGQRWIAQADGMITNKPDTPLTMRFADCTPIFFHDPVKRVIGMAHAGWRGTVAGIAGKTVRLMEQTYGCAPGDIQAAIGPSIGCDDYQVGDEVVDAVQRFYGQTDPLIRHDPENSATYFDLWAANQLDLERAGVRQIEVAAISTASNTHEFFSHRAEAGRTGRFGAIFSL
jgi:YfiH family protein